MNFLVSRRQDLETDEYKPQGLLQLHEKLVAEAPYCNAGVERNKTKICLTSWPRYKESYMHSHVHKEGRVTSRNQPNPRA